MGVERNLLQRIEPFHGHMEAHRRDRQRYSLHSHPLRSTISGSLARRGNGFYNSRERDDLGHQFFQERPQEEGNLGDTDGFSSDFFVGSFGGMPIACLILSARAKRREGASAGSMPS